MSWYGTHATYSRELVRSVLPPRACRTCVYRARVCAGQSREYLEHVPPRPCDRCGLTLLWLEVKVAVRVAAGGRLRVARAYLQRFESKAAIEAYVKDLGDPETWRR